MNEDAYEDYCMDKLHLEQEIDEMEYKLENLLSEVEDLKSDIQYTKDQLANLNVEDYYCE